MDLANLALEGLFTVLMLFAGFTLKAMRDDIGRAREDTHNAIETVRTDIEGVREDMKDHSRSVASLAERMAKQDTEAVRAFATKDDVEAVRKRLHEVSNSVVSLETRAGMRRGGD